MAKLFAFDKPVQSDQMTAPSVTTTELKDALALIYNHMKQHRIACEDELQAALDTIGEACNNENWCIYVP